jgi:hypothetical protein
MRTEAQIREEIGTLEAEINEYGVTLMQDPADEDARRWKRDAHKQRKALLWVLNDPKEATHAGNI